MHTQGFGRDAAIPTLILHREFREGGKGGGFFHALCRGPDGQVKWEADAKNLWVNAGIQHMMDATLSGSSQVTTWYVGLTDGTPTVAAGDTLASHVGWVEVSDYTGNRQAWVEVRSGQSMTNTASKASFPIDQDATTIGGAFLASAATGTTGTLFCAAAFTGGDKSADNGDTLEVTYTFSLADDGA